MNGQLILLLLTLLLQGQNGTVFPPGAGDFSRGSAPAGGSQCDVGYATDPNDGKYSMIVQIHPDAMAAFPKGESGQELPVPIRSDYRAYVEKVIIRVGTGLVENTPPTQAKMSENRTNTQGYIADLKSRTPVNIDRSPDVMNASTQSGLSGLGPSGIGPSGLGNNDAVMPPLSDKSRMPGSIGGGSGPAGSNILPNANQLPNNSVLPNNNLLPGNPFPGSNRQNEVDSFGAPPATSSYPDPTPKTPLYNPIKPAQTAANSNNNLPTLPYQPPSSLTNNSPNPSYTGTGSGSYPNGSSYGAGNNLGNNSTSTLPNNAGINNGYGANGATSNPYPMTANNPNANSYNSHAPNQNSIPFPGQPASFTQSQNFGAVQPSGPSYGATTYQPPPPTPSFAGPGNLESRSPSNQITNRTAGSNEDQNIGRESMLPFLLLFSIVGNVYLGLWMNHLRKRYRELRISMRGLPVSELA